jgi:endoglucanase
MTTRGFILCLALFFIWQAGMGQGFLKAEGQSIVNERGEKVILRGMGLGGWMLQEPYMLKLNGVGPQYSIRQRIGELVGPAGADAFYDAWLASQTRKIDIDSMASWGFNSVRLPMHYHLYTLSVDEEPVAGKNTWLEKGFALTDSLLSWCKANHIYLILDMHAAPGGQGNDLNISDRDSTKPSLWQSAANREKMVALWRKLAERYANEPWIGGYDIINEPNWGFEDSTDKHGQKETKNVPLRQLMMDITAAIRSVDKRHIIIIEGNSWGNNYRGVLPPWDDNMVLSFHKYWNPNTLASIQPYLDLRTKYSIPLWLGESGENNNTWYRECVRLVEGQGIGWSWWPLKKMGTNNPLEVPMTPEYERILKYLSGKGPRPSASEAQKGLERLVQSVRLENNIYHKEVIDALFQR